MRDVVQFATHEHIIGEGAVKSFIYECVNTLKIGIGFHPDTDFHEYINKRNNRRVFTKKEADAMNETLAECIEQCKKLKIDIYAITLEIAQPDKIVLIKYRKKNKSAGYYATSKEDWQDNTVDPEFGGKHIVIAELTKDEWNNIVEQVSSFI